MVINFNEINLRERPNFILRNLDDTAIGILGHILNPKVRICALDISELSFEYPSHDNGEKLDEYDLLTSMRVIDVEGYGQFLLQKPIENDDTVTKIKSCKAYSLEHELTNKKITLEEGTYNFWNPLAPEGTIMGIILSEIPSWSMGYVSEDLIGKYRTFSADNQPILEFLQNELREAYGCIFEFDTYNRKINVRSVEEQVTTKAVYLSKKNLLHKIEVEENTDDLVTALDVHGADELDIRSVNPMGINKIYNLDFYMNESYLPKEIIDKWKIWKQTFAAYQQTYFDITVEQSMLISRLVTEQAVLADLEGELKSLESQQATLVQGMTIDSSLADDLEKVKSDITSKKQEINTQKNSVIATIEDKITTLTNQLKNINDLTAFSGEKSAAKFTDEQMKVLDRYFKCGTLTDSTFVATTTDSYSTDGITVRGFSAIFNLGNLTTLTKTEYTADKTFYAIRGGKIETSNADFTLNSEIVRGTLEVNSDKTFVLSLYLNDGKLNGNTDFSGATLSMTGTVASVSSTSNTLQFKTTAASVYFTRDVTEYQKQSVEIELYEYAAGCLQDMSKPNHYFTVESANFLTLDQFIDFVKQFSLCEKVYLHMDDTVYEPIVLAVEIDFDDLSNFSIEFNEYFRSGSRGADLKQLLDQSISSSHSLDFNQYLYSSFVTSGAKTSVDQFMKSAIDAMKNNIMAGENNELKIDGTGLRCMKYDEASGTYSPKQIWMAHNAIMFTEDNWESATIGIGEFTDKNFGTLYGIVLPALVGTLLAGQNLIIESEKQDGGVAVFKMDAEGASLHNASFNLYGETGGRIDIGAIFGLVGGGDPTKMFVYDQFNNPIGVKTANNKSITKVDDLDANDTPNVNFWLDMYGNSYFRGNIIATAGSIGGWTADSCLYSGSGSTRVALNGDTSVYSEYAIWAGAENPENAKFWVTKNGEMKATSGTYSGTLSAAKLSGTLTAAADGGWIEGCGIRVGKNTAATNGYNFYVDTSGNVNIQGNITLKNGAILWENLNDSVKDVVNSAQNTASNALDAAEDAESLARKIANGTFSNGTFINGTNIYSPTIYADEFVVMPKNTADSAKWTGGYTMYGYYESKLFKMLNIGYSQNDVPFVVFQSPCDAYSIWDFSRTIFNGYCDFRNANVVGLTAKFG